MGHDLAAVEQAREAAGRGAWAEAHALLRACDDTRLAPSDLEVLADAAWWLSRVEESLAVRQQAHAGYVAIDDRRRAAYNAWMLSTECEFIGRPAQAAGWLTKAQRHLQDEAECEEHGFVTYAEAEQAEARGDLDEAFTLARRMTDIGMRCGSRDVFALGLALQGRLLIAAGDQRRGVAALDEVMIDVAHGELGELVTGWLYCLAVALCFDIADVRRAAEWNAAAMAWCDTLPAGTPFHGLCRVDRVELLTLEGEWESASAQADQACAELLAYHPNMAGESFYIAGEIRRRLGDLTAAEEAFTRAHEFGRDPQPGLALVRLAQGDTHAAAAMLRSRPTGDVHARPLAHARLLAAAAEVAVAAGDREAARTSTHELRSIADRSTAPMLEALAATAQGRLALAEDDPSTALEQLRRARSLWLELGLPHEAAQARMLLASASRTIGDDATAALEVRAARAVFEQLGSTGEAQEASDLLPGRERLTGGLTAREIEVLRLVAAGKTNRDIATELVISQHTVARHLNNIFTKLGVSSRAAATAFAYTHELV